MHRISCNISSRLIVAALLCVVGVRTEAQTSGAAEQEPGQQLQALAAAEQGALDSGDSAEILKTGRRLASVALRLLGNLAIRESKLHRAADFYVQSLALEESADTRLDLAFSYVLDGKPDRAIAECAQVTAAQTDNARVWKISAQALLLKDDHRAAADDLSRSWKLDPQGDTGLLLLTTDLRAGRSEEAGRVAQQILGSVGESARAYLAISNAYRAADDLTGTIAELNRAISLDPQFAPAHLALGDAFWKLNEYQYNPDTLREFTEAQRLQSGDYLSNLDLGFILSQYQRYDEAVPYLRQAATADPASPDPWLQLGMNAYGQNNSAEAIAALRKCVALTGSDEARNGYQIRRVYAALSRLEADRGDEHESEQMASRAEQIRAEMLRGPVSSTLSESTGLIVSNSPEKSKPAPGLGAGPKTASSATTEHVELEQQLEGIVAKSLNDAGTALARTRDYAGALPLFRQAATADPTLLPVMRNLGLAAFHTGAYAEAVTALSRALEQNPSDTLARSDLDQARALLIAGRPGTATRR